MCLTQNSAAVCPGSNIHRLIGRLAFPRGPEASSCNSRHSMSAERYAAEPSPKNFNRLSNLIIGSSGGLDVSLTLEEAISLGDHSMVYPCRLTISLIQIGAKGEVHPLETG